MSRWDQRRTREEAYTEAAPNPRVTLFLTRAPGTTSWCSVRFGWEDFPKSRPPFYVVCDTRLIAFISIALPGVGW